MYKRFVFLLSFFAVLQVEQLFAQSSYQAMGQKALLDGDFNSAVSHLEKAVAADSTNVNALYMLGYSYYHAENYKNAVAAFTKVIAVRPNETSAYYYRGKAKSNIANYTANIANSEREKLLVSSIRDFSRAIALSGGEDPKFYQNRAIAYHDYGVLKAQKIPRLYDKVKSLEALKSCILDFQKVLEMSPGRKDIITRLEEARSHLENVNNQ
jgi:tetratricopeptide (TPR) repeat protein